MHIIKVKFAIFGFFCCPFHFLSKTTIPYALKLFMDLSYQNVLPNFRALRLVAEELLHDIFKVDISNYNDLISTLEDVGLSSRTAELWLNVVVKPVFVMMKFVRAAQKADWPLHLVALKAMLPYFATAGYQNCLIYDLLYLIKMSQLLPDLMKKFLCGEHATRYQPGW